MSSGDSLSSREESDERREQPEILFGLLQDDPGPRLKDKLGKGASYLGGVKIATSDATVSFGPEGAPIVTVTATIDLYTDADGHTHIVLGTVQSDGTWEIVSDFTLLGL